MIVGIAVVGQPGFLDGTDPGHSAEIYVVLLNDSGDRAVQVISLFQSADNGAPGVVGTHEKSVGCPPADGLRLKCLYASFVASLPRGVRLMNPS